MRLADAAGVALAAARDEREDDVVADLELGHALADLDDLAGALVAADDGELGQPHEVGDVLREDHVAGDHVLVGVAQAGGR